MKRFLGILAAATMVATLTAGSALAAKPSGAYSATLVVNRDCTMTLTATWPRTAAVDTVYGTWYEDGQYLISTQAPFSNGTWTFSAKRHQATMTIGPAAAGHTWTVLTQFYAGGAHQFELTSNAVTSCAP